MNSTFVGYEELSRSRRALSTEVDNILLDLLNNSSHPTKPHLLIAKLIERTSAKWNNFVSETVVGE